MQCFSTFFKSRNLPKMYHHLVELNVPYSSNNNIYREPSKELAEPLGSAEPRLKNWCNGWILMSFWMCSVPGNRFTHLSISYPLLIYLFYRFTIIIFRNFYCSLETDLNPILFTLTKLIFITNL